MADRYVFSDEAGNFDFRRHAGASKYFILGTVTADDCDVGDRLLQLRRELGWQGHHLDRVFHATEDPKKVRDKVFGAIGESDLRIDATILEKSKAQDHLRGEEALYRMAWYLHFKHVAPRVATRSDRLFVAASRLGSKKKRRQFHEAIDEVVGQVSPCSSHRVAFWSTESDPCLQVADYCTWAIQRKWERKDPGAYELIRSKIKSEFDVWERGATHYY